MSKNLLKSLMIFLVPMLLVTNTLALSPDKFVEQLSEQLISELEKNKDNLKNNHTLAYGIAEKIILPKVDVDGMSRSVLGRKIWTKMSGRQKKEFTKTFTNLIIKTYSKSLTGYDKDEIKIVPLNERYAGKTRVVIKSFIVRATGPKIALKYRMISKSGSWKIYDVSVEGISLLQNFRTQFSSELSKGTIEELIGKMKKN